MIRKEILATGLETISYGGEGYQVLKSFGSWKVAMVCRPESEIGKPIPVLSRHMETDEVFVLLCGEGKIYTAGNGELPADVEAAQMKPMKIYNVPKSTWHAHSISKDARLLIVENSDTGNANSEFSEINQEIY